MEGARRTRSIATHVERKSRYLLAAKLQDKKAGTMTEQSAKFFSSIAETFRQTLTVYGKEFSQFKKLEKQIGLSVYFADPYAAWQRGTNENTNGILRFYFPKGTDFRKVSDKQIESVVGKINNRPRKCLNYRTPNEVMLEAQRGALAI